MPNNSQITLICHSTQISEPEFVVNNKTRCQKFDAYYGEFPIKIVFVNKDIDAMKYQLNIGYTSFLVSGYLILDRSVVPSMVNILAFSNFIPVPIHLKRYAMLNTIGTIIRQPYWKHEWVLTKISSTGWFNGQFVNNYFQVYSKKPFGNQLVEFCPRKRVVQLIGDFSMFTLFDESINNMQLFMKIRPFRLNFISYKDYRNKGYRHDKPDSSENSN